MGRAIRQLIVCRVPCPQDYWEGSNGIFGVYFQSKGLDLAAITSMNSAVSVGTTACRRPSVSLLLRCSRRCPAVFQLLISEPGDNMPNKTARRPTGYCLKLFCHDGGIPL